MLAGHILLVDQIVEFLHRAFSTVMYFSTSCTHVQTLVRRMSFAATLLARQSLPEPTIVIPFRTTVGARFFHREVIRTSL